MTSQASKNSLVASRYASALIDMAEQAKSVEKVEKDLQELGAMIEGSPDLQRLIQNPLVNRDQQGRAVMALAEKAKFQDLTRRFLGVLASNRRMPIVSDVIHAVAKELSRRRGEVSARVRTAYALTPSQTKSLQDQLSKVMGSRVTLEVEVEKDLLGGMTVTVGSRMIDDSVRSKLEKLERSMNSGTT